MIKVLTDLNQKGVVRMQSPKIRQSELKFKPTPNALLKNIAKLTPFLGGVKHNLGRMLYQTVPKPKSKISLCNIAF